MSAHYLIDLFSTPVSTAPIVDVTEPLDGRTLLNGAFVVRVPDTGALIDPITGRAAIPQNLGDLVLKKYQGLLTFFAGFAHVAYDDLLDASGVNTGAAGTAGTFGERGTIALNPGASLTSNTTVLATTPTSAILTWEVFDYTDADPKTGRFARTYHELPTVGGTTTAQVSFDSGVTFTAATDLGVFNIPVLKQGSNLVVKITNASGSRLHIGSWALIY